MAWKDMSSTEKSDVLLGVGILTVLLAVAIFAVTILILAVAYTPWPFKLVSATTLVACTAFGASAIYRAR